MIPIAFVSGALHRLSIELRPHHPQLARVEPASEMIHDMDRGPSSSVDRKRTERFPRLHKLVKILVSRTEQRAQHELAIFA